MSGPVRIVRKVGPDGDDAAFWLNGDGVVIGWWIIGSDDTPERGRADGEGWEADESRAQICGTTLSALHQELTEGGEG